MHPCQQHYKRHNHKSGPLSPLDHSWESCNQVWKGGNCRKDAPGRLALALALVIRVHTIGPSRSSADSDLRMYPENETYGVWPRSGEIDIAQIRGNSPKNYSDGRDTVTSALHWGVWQNLDQSARTTGKFVRRRYDLSAGFHTYGLEWTETTLFTWIDDAMFKIEQTGWGPSWGGDMYQRSLQGNTSVSNLSATGQLYVTAPCSSLLPRNILIFFSPTRPPNIWSSTGLYNTPFDQPFHLILNVAVGSSNGFFQ